MCLLSMMHSLDRRQSSRRTASMSTLTLPKINLLDEPRKSQHRLRSSATVPKHEPVTGRNGGSSLMESWMAE